MEWTSKQFGASHEGGAGALLADGKAPKPVYFDVGSGADVPSSDSWWIYDGTLGAPRATYLRGTCSCGWRGERRHPIDWERLKESEASLEEHGTAGPRGDWEEHLQDVERRSIPLPSALQEHLERVQEQLGLLVDDAPLAALKAGIVLEGIAAGIARTAARQVEADELSPGTIAQALGLGEQEARTRLARIRFRS